MKKIIFFILLFIIFYSGTLFAVPAISDSADIKQPDGKTFKAKLKGDEFYHWYEDEQGYTILKDTETKFWRYAKKHKHGHLEKSKYIVGKDLPGNIEKGLRDEKKLKLAKSHRQQFFSQNRSPSLQQNENMSKASSSGYKKSSVMVNKKNLVILVQFADKKFHFSHNDIENLYKGDNYTEDGAVGSVKEYLNEVSYGKHGMEFIISSFVVTLDKSYVFYGENDESGSDKHPREMVEQAIAKLDEMNFNFAQADGDGDGWVDVLTVIHAGCGEEYTGADSKDIWSHQWSIHSEYTTKDNKKILKYITVPERRGADTSKKGLVRIGVIAHELMHVFGIPDLYDTTYKSKGLGYFCLMANGLWNGNNGTSPAHPCAWVKYKLGFIQPKEELSKGQNTIEVSASTYTAFYKISPFGSEKEYFMIENRQPYGFDKALPGGNVISKRGLLIYHIDERKTNNNDRTHYLVALEEADATTNDWTLFDLARNKNNGTEGDYFRKGTQTTFNDDNTSSPNSKSYTSQESGINIFDISESGKEMFFWTENLDEFIEKLEDKTGFAFLKMVMNFSQIEKKDDLKNDEEAQNKIAKYFNFTSYEAEEVNKMYDIYSKYVDDNDGTVLNVSKDKMSLFNATDANLINRLNYILRTSNGTQEKKSVGVISNGNDAPVEKNNISRGQNMRFTGTDVVEKISSCLKEYGYLMPKFNDMKLKSEYDIIEVFENTDISNYKDYIFFAGAKTVLNYDLSKIVCFPNPAKNGKITITNLPTTIDKLNIYIYTISGQMINSFSIDDTQVLGNGTRFFVWNCKTKSGNDVAQGVYMILIKTQSDKIIKKIAIIR